MGQIRSPQPVLLLFAVFSADAKAFGWTQKRAEERFGKIVLRSKPFLVDTFTAYYTPSMGANLYKELWAFDTLMDPAGLPDIKRLTNDWETEYGDSADNVSRPLNIDPGYIDLGKFILASTKDHAHRIYLSGGIFAETTLIWTQKHWKSLPWSYPDYQSESVQQFLTQCREYLRQNTAALSNHS